MQKEKMQAMESLMPALKKKKQKEYEKDDGPAHDKKDHAKKMGNARMEKMMSEDMPEIPKEVSQETLSKNSNADEY